MNASPWYAAARKAAAFCCDPRSMLFALWPVLAAWWLAETFYEAWVWEFEPPAPARVSTGRAEV